jgi:hypothetical protein
VPTPPTFVSYTETGNTSVTPPSTGVTTATVAVQSGDLIVIWGGAEDWDGSGNLTLSISGGLTGTLTVAQSDNTSTWAPAVIGTASATGSGNIQGKVVGTLGTGALHLNCGVWVWRSHGGVGTSGKAHQAAGSLPSLALTVAANSGLSIATTDWAAVNTARTYRQVNATNPTERGHFADGATWHYDAYDFLDTGSGGAVTVGETVPVGQKPNTLAVEILASAGAAAIPPILVMPRRLAS